MKRILKWIAVLNGVLRKNAKDIHAKNFIFLTAAGVINAFGIVCFLVPVQLYDSGISGTSMLLGQITPAGMSLSVFFILLNVPIFIYGLKKQGLVFTVYAIYAVMTYSVSAAVISAIPGLDVSISSPFAGTDLLLCALFGGMISGAGSGIALRSGGAMDGIEVLAVIFAKRLGMSVGSFVMVYNVILYIICGIVIQSWILPLYSIVTYMAALRTVDFFVDGLDRSKSVMIVTTKARPVCRELSDTFGQGITILDGRGYYSDSAKTVVYIILNRFQIGKMRDIVYKNDPMAYIAISEVADVFKAGQQDGNEGKGRNRFPGRSEPLI